MQGRWWGLLLFALLLCAPVPSRAGEFDGKLERVDLQSVTVRGCDNSKVVLALEQKDREKAAPFLGKSVTVVFKTENGEYKALFFRSKH